MSPGSRKITGINRVGPLVIGLCLLLLASPGRGAESDLLERYFDSLRSRGLFTIAEEYATSRLTSGKLGAADSSLLSIELARTLVDHGILYQGAQRQELWEASSKVLRDQIASRTATGERLQLETWRSILEAVQGKTLAFQSSLQPELPPLRQQATDSLNTAVRSLRVVTDQLENSRRDEKDSLTPQRRIRLRQQADLMCGESLVWLAQLASGDANSSALLQDAGRFLERADHPRRTFEWNRHIAVIQARIARLAGDIAKSRKILDRAEAGETPREIKDEVLAERLRLELSQGNIPAALQLVIDRFKLPGSPVDELRAMAVETLLIASHQAGQQGNEAAQQQFLEEAQRQHEKTFGIWRMQTALLLSRSQQEQKLGKELATIVRSAEAAWNAGEIDLALSRYTDATQLAIQKKLPDPAFEYGLTKASILLQNQRWSEADIAFRTLLESLPQHARAAEADLLRCYAIGQAAPGSNEFVAALEHHVQTYPESSTRSDARWMLALEKERQGLLFEAITNHQQIPVDSPRKSDADRQILRIVQQLQQTPGRSEQDKASLESLAVSEIRRIVPPFLKPDHSLTPTEAETLLDCVQICLRLKTPLITEAEQVTALVRRRAESERKITLEQNLPDRQRWEAIDRRAIQLQIIVLAGQKKLQDAQQVLQSLKQTDPDALLSILASLTDLTARLDAGNVKELGLLQRLTIQEIAANQSELSPEQRAMLQQAEIQASLALEDWPAAIAGTEDLLIKYPEDRQLLRQLIDVSLKKGHPPDLQRAKETWMRLEKLEPKGSPAWIESRISIAELLAQSGDKPAAKRLLGVTKTLYPQLGNAELKARGDALWESIK